MNLDSEIPEIFRTSESNRTEMPDMEFWLRSGILEKQGNWNLIKSNA